MIRIEEIVENVARNHPQANLDLLRRAYLFSAREHKGQKRASGESYLVHPLEVASILANMKLDEVSVATGLLHDVVEDTLVDLDTIREYFGEEVENAIKLDPNSEPAWSYKTNLLIEAVRLAEMDGKMDQKTQLEKQRAEAQKRTTELSQINQKKKEEEEAKKAASPAKT